MKPFLDADFLLHTDTARELYHQHAAVMPIIDYHCHLHPKEIAENHAFTDLTEAWLGGKKGYLSPTEPRPSFLS